MTNYTNGITLGDGHETNGQRWVDKEEASRSVEVEADAFVGDGGDILTPSRSQGRWCLVVERLEGGEGGGFDLHFLDGDVGGVINCVDQSGIVRTLYKLEFQIRNRDSCRVLPKFGIYFVKHREVNRLVCW